MTAFNLSALTPSQRSLVETAIRRCRYDFTRCLPRLRSQWGKSAIDVVFSDLSRFSAGARAAGGPVPAGRTYLVGEKGPETFTPPTSGHIVPSAGAKRETRNAADGSKEEAFRTAQPGHTHGDVHVDDPETGAVGHGIQHRHRVLGLAWSNGKIELDTSLESQSELAQEVFLSEGAHICDWLDPAMTPTARERIWDAMHLGTDSAIGDHNHGWFDVGAYETFVGESFMALFTQASSDVAVTLTQFTHKVTPEAIKVARELLDIDADAEVEVTIPRYFATKRGSTFHDAHKGIAAARRFSTRELAVAAGLRPCGVCRP